MVGGSDWQIRCLKCGLTRRAIDAGIVRVGAVGRKYTLGWCSRCRWLPCAAVERTPPAEFDVVMPARKGGEPTGADDR